MTIATLLPNAKQQFISGDGVPLAGGSVYMYVPATTTLKTTWQDSGETIQNTNPIILDANGEAIIYGSGEYRQVVYDADGNLIWDGLTTDLTATLQAAGITYCGTSTGTANAQILSPDPAITSLAIGQLLAFTAGFTNTAPMTIQVSSLSPDNLYYGGSAAAQDSVQAGGYTIIEWDGTHFQLANPVTPSYAANTFVANATNSTNFPTGVALSNSQLAGRGASGNIAAISLDNSTLNMSGTTIAVATSTATQLGASSPDNSTIVAIAGVYSVGTEARIVTPLNVSSIVLGIATTAVTAGDIVSGANLTINTYNTDGSSAGVNPSGDVASGTWQALQSCTDNSGGNLFNIGLWQRIA